MKNDLNNEKDKLLISKLEDKLRFCKNKNKIQTTDFLSLAEQKLVENYLKSEKIKNYIFTGGFEEAERKMVLFYPEKFESILDKIDINEFIRVIRITLPNDLKGEYSHKNYLGGIMKLGIQREKIGDILVDETGADILVMPEMVKFLLNNIFSLTRFSKSKIEEIQIENLKPIQTKTEIIKITVASMRLDNIISELYKCSRTKSNEVLMQERVLVNYLTQTKPSKEIKEKDVVTIRGKGRFIIKNIIGNSRKGRIFVEVEKFI